MGTALIVAGLILALAAVGLVAFWALRRRKTAGGEQTFEGTFTFGWEVSSFVPGPDGAVAPRYWVAWTPESRFMETFKQHGYDPAWTPGYGRVRTKFLGRLDSSSKTGYGHMGQYEGQVTVLKVLSMSKAEQGP